MLETILIPHGITSEQSGIVGAVFIISGIIGAVVLPVQEGTSLGIILLMGQVSGVLIVYIFEVVKDISGSVAYLCF